MRNQVSVGKRQIAVRQGRLIRHIIAAIGIVLIMVPLQVCGGVFQEPVQEPVQEPASNDQLDGAELDVAAMKAIANGIKTLKSVRQSLEVQEQFDLDPPPVRQEEQTTSPDLMELLSSELENARQVEDLRERIRKLIELDRQRILQPLTDNPDTEADPGSTAGSATGSNLNMDASVNAAANATVPPVDNIDGNDETGFGSPAAPAIDTKRILSQPPDQLALADSLFYSGELELAYDLYRRARKGSSNNMESVWIDYQTACCLRRLGNADGASKILREIAESAGAEPVGANARWWLEQIDQKKLIQEELNTFEQFIKRKENENVTNQTLPRTSP